MPVSRLSLRWPVLREGLLFGVIASLPTLIWLVVDFAATGTVGSRSGQPAAAYWQRFLEIGPALQKIVLFWLLPPGMAFAFLCLYALVAFLGVISRSTAVAIIGGFLYQFILSGILQGRETGLYQLFTSEWLRRIIDGGDASVRSHGSMEMPVWGDAFKKRQGLSQEEANARIEAIVRYLGLMQDRLAH